MHNVVQPLLRVVVFDTNRLQRLLMREAYLCSGWAFVKDVLLVILLGGSAKWTQLGSSQRGPVKTIKASDPD